MPGAATVEKSRKHNHFKRVRYNTSCITTNITETGADFEKVPESFFANPFLKHINEA